MGLNKFLLVQLFSRLTTAIAVAGLLWFQIVEAQGQPLTTENLPGATEKVADAPSSSSDATVTAATTEREESDAKGTVEAVQSVTTQDVATPTPTVAPCPDVTCEFVSPVNGGRAVVTNGSMPATVRCNPLTSGVSYTLEIGRPGDGPSEVAAPPFISHTYYRPSTDGNTQQINHTYFGVTPQTVSAEEFKLRVKLTSPSWPPDCVKFANTTYTVVQATPTPRNACDADKLTCTRGGRTVCCPQRSSSGAEMKCGFDGITPVCVTGEPCRGNFPVSCPGNDGIICCERIAPPNRGPCVIDGNGRAACVELDDTDPVCRAGEYSCGFQVGDRFPTVCCREGVEICGPNARGMPECRPPQMNCPAPGVPCVKNTGEYTGCCPQWSHCPAVGANDTTTCNGPTNCPAETTVCKSNWPGFLCCPTATHKCAIPRGAGPPRCERK